MSNYYIGSENNYELYHYGVLGMKWGIRRYQNKDGSLTSEGLKRYNKAKSSYKEARRQKVPKNIRTEFKKKVKVAKNELELDIYGDRANEILNKKGVLPTPNKGATKGAIIGMVVAGLPGALIGSTIGEENARKLNENVNRGQSFTKSYEKESVQTLEKRNTELKKDKLERAKKHDLYDMYFAEVKSARSNGPEDDTPEKWIEEYKKYLDDPEKWLNNKS